MKDVEIFNTDHQINYDIVINTIEKIFNDEIKHCHQEIDNNIAKHLESFRDEFLFLFQHAYKDEEYKNSTINKKI